MRPHSTTVAVLVAVVLGLGIAAASNHTSGVPSPEALPGPFPTPDDAGASYNDVRDEASHPDDANGFPDARNGDFYSPKGDALILDAFVAPGERVASPRPVGADVDNIANLVLRGDNYRSYERIMYPGTNQFAAWWGWWSDTGGGGDLQANAATRQAPFVGEPNGAVDDADDCEAHTWDEFTWRGEHPCPEAHAHPARPTDQMFAFVQPGTHEIHLNGFAPLGNQADEPVEPDFKYRDRGQGWEEADRVLDLEYDSSLLISTRVVTAVNPREVDEDAPETKYDPFSAALGLKDPDRDHAVDVDVYTALHPAIEAAYRAAVWDPATGPNPQRGDNLDLLHEAGPKEWLKEDGTARVAEAQETAAETQEQALAPSEPQRGFADDLTAGPFFHEPNEEADDYNDWATRGADTYGGLDDDYYEPGPDRGYDGYQAGEHFWVDHRLAFNHRPTPVTFGFWLRITPEAPSPNAPLESTAQEGQDNTKSPSFLQFFVNHGTWYDANGDGWVGDAGEDGHPYDNGTTDDPNDYSSAEFRGTCAAALNVTLYPTSDTDGDGTNDWGRAGIYVMGPESFAYGAPWMDVIGHSADGVLDPLRDNEQLGPVASLLFPERDRLGNHRTEGPVEVRNYHGCNIRSEAGRQDAQFWVVLPTGTMDFTFKVETEATLVDPLRQSQHGDNRNKFLEGRRSPTSTGTTASCPATPDRGPSPNRPAVAPQGRRSGSAPTDRGPLSIPVPPGDVP